MTLVKTCEPVAEMRECRMPRDWSLLALQNVRTGKSHYLVICKCPETNILGMLFFFIVLFYFILFLLYFVLVLLQRQLFKTDNNNYILLFYVL